MITREMTPRDRRFVVPTWAHGSRYDMALSERFRLIDRILDGGARVVTLATSDVAVHAWAAGDGDVLHYVYVPPELRGEGLARRALVELFGSYPDHITVSHPWPRPSRRFRYSPDALLRSEVAA